MVNWQHGQDEECLQSVRQDWLGELLRLRLTVEVLSLAWSGGDFDLRLCDSTRFRLRGRGVGFPGRV